MSLNILPLAITMMAGPQIMSAIVFVTHRRAVRVSLAFLCGVTLAIIIDLVILRALAGLLGDLASNADQHQTAGTVVQIVLVALLAAAALKNYIRRETIEPPKWLGELMTASTRKAFLVGLMLISLMPSDIVVMLTVSANLETNNEPITAAIPFIVATIFIAALPLLAFLLFRRRAMAMMPAVRDWMNSHSWLINIIVCAIFIVLVL